ncbi:hypothetical protein GGF32_003696 [Allomyces javanicus]|nr:hypothetical protein GGF32_003696 [Allomyces javanicus]
MSSLPSTTLASTRKYSTRKHYAFSVVPVPKADQQLAAAATAASASSSRPAALAVPAPTAVIGTLAVGQAVFYHDSAFKTWLLGTVVVADASGIDVEPAYAPEQLKTIRFDEVDKKPFAAVPSTSQYKSRNVSLDQFLEKCTDANMARALRKFRDRLEGKVDPHPAPSFGSAPDSPLSDLPSTDPEDGDDDADDIFAAPAPRPAKKRKAESLLDASQSDGPSSSQTTSITSPGRQLARAAAQKKAKVAPPAVIDVSDSESSLSSEEDPANDLDFEDAPAKSRRKKSTTKTKTPSKSTPSKRTTTKTAATAPSPKVITFAKRARHDPSSSAPTGPIGRLGPATLDRPTTLASPDESSDDDHGPTAADHTLRPGDSVLALDLAHDAYVPARVITQSATELTVHLYRGLVELNLPRTQIRVFGDRDFGRVPLAPMDSPRIDVTYRNPVLERRVLSLVPALDEIVKGERASWRHATWRRGGRVAHRELARATGGNPYSPDEAALVERMLKARYLDGFDVDEEEARGDVVMTDAAAAAETASKPKSKKKKAAAAPAKAKKPPAPAAKVPVAAVSSARAAKNKSSYVELSDEEEDDDEEEDFVQPRPGLSTSSARKAAPARAPPAPPTLSLLARATVFAAGPADVRTSESAYIQLVLVPECMLRLLCLTHLLPLKCAPTTARGDGVSSRTSSTHAADGHDSDTSSLSTVRSGYASSDNDDDAARAGALPRFMRHYLRQLDVGSPKWNNPATATASDAWLEYALLAEDETSVLPQAETLLKDAHWVAGLLELYRSSRGK